MPIEAKFRRGGEDLGFGFWRRDRSSRRGGTLGNHYLPPDRIDGEGNIQITKPNRGVNVEAYGKTGSSPAERTSASKSLGGQPKKSINAHVSALFDEEILEPMFPSRRHSPNIIAKLMGLDPLLPPQSKNAPTREKNREFKDVFVVTDTGKVERKGRISPKRSWKSTQKDADVANRVFSDGDLRRSHEFDEAIDILDSRRDLLLKFLEEPTSVFKSQRKDLPETRITILKSSSILKSERNSGHRSNTSFDLEDDPGSLPTRIVVLKPSLRRVDQRVVGTKETSVDQQFCNEKRSREFRRPGRREALDELRESDGTLKARRSREIAREVTRHMKEAAEMQTMAHNERYPICPRGYSTLGEMLASSEAEISEKPTGSSPNLQERFPIKKRIPRGFESKDVNALKRSKSVLSSLAIYIPGVDREDSLKRDSSPLTFQREVHGGCDHPPDNLLSEEKSRSSDTCSSSSAVEKYCSVDSEEKSGSKEISSTTEKADQPSPISVLETHSESRSPPESFERLSADLRELRLKLQLLKRESTGAYSDTMISSDEDDDEQEQEQGEAQDRELAYLRKVLDEARIRDWDEFFCGFFAPEVPICRDVFEKMEKMCYNESSWRMSERKLLFDMFNVVLADILAMNMELRPWVKNCRADQRKNLLEEAWESLCRRRREAISSGPRMFFEDPKWLDVVDDVDSIGREMERMVKDDLVQELLFDVLSLRKHM